jgi:hypothetical protein
VAAKESVLDALSKVISFCCDVRSAYVSSPNLVTVTKHVPALVEVKMLDEILQPSAVPPAKME